MFIPLKATEGEKLEYHLGEKLLQGFFFASTRCLKTTWKVSFDNFSIEAMSTVKIWIFAQKNASY